MALKKRRRSLRCEREVEMGGGRVLRGKFERRTECLKKNVGERGRRRRKRRRRRRGETLPTWILSGKRTFLKENSR